MTKIWRTLFLLPLLFFIHKAQALPEFFLVDTTIEITSNSPICSGQTLTLSATSISTATYTWQNPSGTVVSIVEELVIPEASIDQSGTYTLAVDIPNQDQQIIFTEVLIKPSPDSPLIQSNSPLCEGGNLEFTTALVDQASYKWYNGLGTLISEEQNPIISNVSILEAGSYFLELSVNDCAAEFSPVIVEINGPPSLSSLDYTCDETASSYQIDFEILEGKQPFTANGLEGVFEDSLFTSDAILSGTAFSIIVQDSFLCGSVTIENSFDCNCISSVGQMQSELIELCPNEQLEANYTANHFLDPNDTLIFVIHDRNDSELGNLFAWNGSPVFERPTNALATQTYYLSAVVLSLDDSGQPLFEDPCKSVSAGTPFKYKATNDINIQGTRFACIGASVRYIGTELPEVDYYIWQSPNGLDTTLSNVLIMDSITNGAVGPYLSSAIIDGCTVGLSDTLNLEISIPEISANAGQDQIICNEFSTYLKAIIPEVGSGFWSTANDVEIEDPLSSFSLVQNLDQGNNFLTWTLTDTYCPDYSSDTVNIYVAPVPVANSDQFVVPIEFFESEFSIIENDAILLNESLRIEFLTEPESGRLVNNEDGSFYFEKEEAGEFFFEYVLCQENEACNELCDTASVQLTVFVDPKHPGVFVPEGLTLNNDGLNDILIIEGIEKYPNNQLTIFNRWGEIVFNAHDYQNDWAGTYNGQPLPQGTYYYLLITSITEKRNLKGTITIFR